MPTIKGYRFLLKYIALLELLFIISRMALVWRYNIEVEPLFFIYSLRMDIMILSALLLVPIILYSLNLLLLTRLFLSFVVFVVAYLELSNYLFFEEFGTRLNYLFIAYLEYPKEVFDMIWRSYKVALLVGVPILLLMALLFFRTLKPKLSSISHKLILFPMILPFLFLGLRSSVDSSTPNQSFYSYSSSTLKNDMANNTIFSLAYASYLKAKDKIPDYGKVEGELQTELTHLQKSSFSKKRDVVLVLMESFGHTYVGAMGGTPTTPRFDSMSKEGLFCSNMYSSSNRSNRGFEAVLGSLYPLSSDTYLKLAKSQNNFWTVARAMREQGYRTVFLYGGDSKFDNMRGFAINNGFDEVIDKFDFDLSIKRYTWGVSDEELYKRAESILEESKEPLFLMMFTLSSHKPFDYPDGKIEYYDKAPVESFANSVKYADFALGGFYDYLKKREFFEDGLLTVVADHNAHIFGEPKIPVREFRIPALFIGKDIEPKEIKEITHQIDIAPTMLDMAGVETTSPTMGRDLTQDEEFNALIIHHRAFAYLKNGSFVLYQKDTKPAIYDFDYNQIEDNSTLIQEGLNYIYSSYKIYKQQLHKGNF